MTGDDLALGVLPLFHIFGLNVVLGLSLLTGGRILLVERFEPVSVAELVELHNVTVVAGAPAMYAAWSALPEESPGVGDRERDRRRFASVRLAVSGAAPLSIEVAEAMERRYGVVVRQGYGLTEASPVVTTSVFDEPARPRSVGRPLPGVDVRLVDEEGEDSLLGDRGEVWVRGDNVFPGYWEDPDATRRALTADGWLRTGDIGVIGEDGDLYLVDRAKDLIIVSGFNVYPAEVEAVLGSHPSVVDVAVVGVPNAQTGEAVMAYVVMRKGNDATSADLVAWCATSVARYKCPTEIRFVDEIPHGVAGKLLRRTLRPPPGGEG
jgi:long-chain acyl-CoA synthetase